MRRLGAYIAASAIVIAGLVSIPTAASAEEVEPAAAAPQTVSADALPTVQIDNGIIWAAEIVGDIAYVGGEFSNARPAGAAPGTNLIPRSNFLAFNVKTGALVTTFAPSFNGRVNDIAASPDGTRLYVVGTFTQVNGLTRNRIAVFNLPSGTLSTTVIPDINGVTQSVDATNDTVFVGGYFSAVNNSARARVAAVRASNGSLLPFRPIVDNGMVQSIVASPDATSVVLAGSFTSVAGGQTNPGYGLSRVDAQTGDQLPMPVNAIVRNGGESSGVTNLNSDGVNFYGVGWHYGGGGNMEGAFSANWSDFELKWIEDCHGDTYDIAPAGDFVYMASHKHYCGNSGGFPQTEPWSFYHSTAATKTVEGVNTRDIYGYPDHPGRPRPDIPNWYPQTDVGTYSGKSQAVWTVTGNDEFVVFGGEFPRVNGSVQQGLVRYTTRDDAPNKQGPRFLRNQTAWAPSVASLSSGSVRVAFQTVWDRDDLDLTYRIYRDNENAAGLLDTRVSSTPFWKPQLLKFSEVGLTPGATHRYRVTATDPWNNILRSDWVNVTVSSTAASPYIEEVFTDDVSNLWRLGEPSGSVALDWVGGSDLALTGNVTRGVAGAIGGDSDLATTFENGMGTSSQEATAPDTFSVEAWFKTTSSTGGKIVGFGNSATGTSSSYDRHLYIDNAGRLWFGVHPGGVRTVNTTTTYRDGQWHQVVGTLGPNGMRLYVDGKLAAQRLDVTTGQAYTGYWKIGNDNLSGWTNRPSSDKFEGQIDDVSVYTTPLSLNRIRQHYIASGRTPSGVPSAPADAYGALVYNAEPQIFWRFNETSGSGVADSGKDGYAGTLSGSYQRNQAGALAGNVGRAVTFTGNGGNAYSQLPFASPGAFSLETWFRTTSTNGGKLIGFGSSQTGGSSNYDRHIYMQDNGQLVFGTWTGVASTITSPSSYNNGAWHHVTGTQGADGLKLYVDGVLVGSDPQTSAQDYQGYWRVGGDTTWGSTSANLIGSFDETAVYDRVLTGTEVANHFAVGSGTPVPNQPPVAAFTSSVDGLTVSVNGSSSSDPDGSIASYAWDFGDDSTGSGATASHTYTAAGTYSVKLTVTDNNGATHSTTRAVTVAAPNQPPIAAFTSSVDGLTVSVDGSSSSDPDGTIALYEWDFGDSTTGTGPTASHTYTAGGTYTVRLTVTDNNGATNAKTAQVVVVAPNQPPVAAFTSSTSGLTVSVNGSSSSDPDGSIASYAWDFGDDSTGSGATASHTYTAAGTYSVKLTVTDNNGATNSKTTPVTVSEPTVPGSGVLASDDFNRTVANGWGTADQGGVWTLRGTASRFSVADGAGVISVPSASTQYADLNSVSSTSTRVDAVFSVDKLVESQYVAVVGRRVGSANYIARLRLQEDGGVRLFLLQDGATSIAPMLQVPITIVPGQKYVLSIEVTGVSPTTVKAKLWKQGETEPGWQREGTNTLAGLQAPGAVSVFSYLPSTPLAPSVVSFDKITVTDPTAE